MGSLTGTTREELAALLTEHCGDIDAAAATAGVNKAALYQRVRRAGLSLKLQSQWGAEATAEPEPMPPNAFALAALELAVENQGLREALIGAEGVIDRLAVKCALMAQELGASNDSRITRKRDDRRRDRFLAAVDRLWSDPSPEPA